MELHADFDKRAAVHAGTLEWQASPMPGVSRRMLDRIGDEVARATSIVRYDPGSHFKAHVHEGGEEFLVLDGVFQDEQGEYPAGYYVRNPPQSRHTPGSEPGCTILVKLWQFRPDDREAVRIDTHAREPVAAEGRSGVRVIPLYEDGREAVRIECWAPDQEIELQPEGGIELFVLSGGFREGGETFRAQGWLRLPPGAPLKATAAGDGCRVWVKSGHLLDAGPPGSD